MDASTKGKFLQEGTGETYKKQGKNGENIYLVRLLFISFRHYSILFTMLMQLFFINVIMKFYFIHSFIH